MILPIAARHEYIRIRDDALDMLGMAGLPCLPLLLKDGASGEWCTVFQMNAATYVFRSTSIWRAFPALKLPMDTVWGAELVDKTIYISEFWGDRQGLVEDPETRAARVAQCGELTRIK